MDPGADTSQDADQVGERGRAGGRAGGREGLDGRMWAGDPVYPFWVATHPVERAAEERLGIEGAPAEPVPTSGSTRRRACVQGLKSLALLYPHLPAPPHVHALNLASSFFNFPAHA
jgi:hypothetical protein